MFESIGLYQQRRVVQIFTPLPCTHVIPDWAEGQWYVCPLMEIEAPIVKRFIRVVKVVTGLLIRSQEKKIDDYWFSILRVLSCFFFFLFAFSFLFFFPFLCLVFDSYAYGTIQSVTQRSCYLCTHTRKNKFSHLVSLTNFITCSEKGIFWLSSLEREWKTPPPPFFWFCRIVHDALKQLPWSTLAFHCF